VHQWHNCFETNAAEAVSNIHFSEFLDGIFGGLWERLSEQPSDKSASLYEMRSMVDAAMQESDEATNLAKHRFRAEKNVTIDIYTYLRTQWEVAQKRERESGEQKLRFSAVEEIVPAHYVEVEASFSSFKRTRGGQTLRSYFLENSNKEGRSFSNFAVVMQFCTHTHAILHSHPEGSSRERVDIHQLRRWPQIGCCGGPFLRL
jgi:hypothetical protein